MTTKARAMDLLLEDGRQEPRTLEAVLIKRFHSTPLSNAFSRITVHTFLPETVRRQYPREKKPLETPLVARSRLRACISTIRFAQPPFLELWRFNLLLPAIRASQAPKVFPSSKNIPLTFSIHLDSLGDVVKKFNPSSFTFPRVQDPSINLRSCHDI